MSGIQDQPLVHDYQTFYTKTTEKQTTWKATGGKEVIIRNMVLDDCDFAGRMYIEAFHDKMQHLVGGPDGLPRVTEAMQKYNQLIPDRYHRYFIAEVGGERAGVVQLQRQEDIFTEPEFDWVSYVSCCSIRRLCCLVCAESSMKPIPQYCHIAVIAVDSKFRGCGVGKALLDRAEQEGRALGCTKMSLDVTATNRARNLYERQGYTVVRKSYGCCFTWCSYGIKDFFFMEKYL